MPFIRQTNFLGGELSPLLHGRTDLPIFGRGLRTMRNFFASRHGAAVSRPGSQFVGYAGGVSLNVRLIPFVYSDDQSLCLEFGHGYIRFHTNGATLLNGASPVNTTTSGADQPYTLASPYSYYDLSRLQWVQTGDILTIVHPSYSPRELRRYANTNWGPLNAIDAPPTVLNEVAFARPAPYFRTGSGYPVLKSTHPDGSALTFADTTHPLKPWKWLATLTVQDTATGNTFETAPWEIAESWTGVLADLPVELPNNKVALFPDKAVTILRGAHLELSTDNVVDNSYRELSMNVYRGQGEVFGQVGSVAVGGDDFVDTGAEPDYALQPPRGTNPFTIIDYLNVEQPPRRPTAVTFFQDRRVFAAGTDLFFSAAGDYTNHDPQIIHTAKGALHYQLAARRFEEAVSFISLNKLIIHTKSSAWSMSGQQGEPLTFESVDAQVVDEVGSLGLPPLVVNGVIYFARAKGLGVRALAPAQGGFEGQDVSVVSQHLFHGSTTGLPAWLLAQVEGQPVLTQRSIIDWTYAEDPWGLIWAVREDGMLLSFTPTAEGGAWARHDTQGYVRAICSVPEGGEDAVYMAVVRATGGSSASMCIERMTSRQAKGTADDGACLDCSLRYAGAPTVTITGLQHLAGNTVWAVAKGNAPFGPLVVSGAGVLTLPELPVANDGEDVVLYVGLNFTADLETLDVAQGEARTKTKVTNAVGFEIDESSGISVGQDFAHLRPGLKRSPADSYAAPVPQTGLFLVPVSGAWGLTGRCVLRQSVPLWVTVVGLVREVSLGD